MAIPPRIPIIIVTTIGCLALIVGLSIQPIFDKILHSMLMKMIPLRSSSSTLSSWENPTPAADTYIKFRFFDFENPDEVAAGQKPKLRERGPYVYNETKIKHNVTFLSDDQVYYQERRTMTFIPHLSVGNESDTFVTINIPLVSVASMLKSDDVLEDAFNIALKVLFSKTEPLFKRYSVKDLLWGYKDPILDDAAFLAKTFNLQIPVPPGGMFGLFYQKNNTDDGAYIVNTGVSNINHFMRVEQWDGHESLPYWKTSYCNQFNGTDGTMYPPYVDKSAGVSVFSDDLCRTLKLEYSQSVPLDEYTELYQYKPPASLFSYPPSNMDNECYCVGPECPHSGVLNISACQQGAPVFASQPHFLNGPYYENLVKGLKPNESIHNTYINVEPTLGLVLEGAKRVQLNLDVQNISHISMMARLPSLLLPLLWLEESAKINSYGRQMLDDQLYSRRDTVAFWRWFLTIGGACLLLLILFIIASAAIKKRYQKYREFKGVDERSPLLNKPEEEETDNDWGWMIGQHKRV